jgi:hypothetical protein
MHVETESAGTYGPGEDDVPFEDVVLLCADRDQIDRRLLDVSELLTTVRTR